MEHRAQHKRPRRRGLSRLGHLTTTRPWLVLALAAFTVIAGGWLGADVDKHMSAGGFTDPSSESERATQVLADRFGAGTPNVILLVTATDGDVTSPAAAAAGQALHDRLATEPDMADVVSFWSEHGAPPLRSDDGSQALVVGHLEAVDQPALFERIEQISSTFATPAGGTSEPITVEIGGGADILRAVTDTATNELTIAETVALPVTLLLLILVFRSLVAAALPLIVGAASIATAMGALSVTARVTEVSVQALGLASVLGLGLAIDYSLLVVTRYREEYDRTGDPASAAGRTVETAGRTVVFSAVIVAVSLSVTVLFPGVFLRSVAYAGMAVVVVATLFTITALPAALVVLGPRIDKWTVRQPARRHGAPKRSFWARSAAWSMARPARVLIVVTGALLAAAAPVMGLRLTDIDDRVLAPDHPARTVGDDIRHGFSSVEGAALPVVPEHDQPLSHEDLDTYASELAQLPGVDRVDTVSGTFCGVGLADKAGCAPGDQVADGSSSPTYAGFQSSEGSAYLSVVPNVDALSTDAEQLIRAVRAHPAPTTMLVGGPTASMLDTRAGLLERLPLALAALAAVTLIALFLMTGSVLIPIKALALNLLGVAAASGAMVMIFQHGHLAGLVNITATGGLDLTMVVMLVCVAFGLSMDYEVFLLGRIIEERAAGADNYEAVVRGLGRTGRIVTAAAVLISTVFVSFAAFGSVSFIKLFGYGLTTAVLLDAFVIRAALVPAFMSVAGNANWWAPGPLARFHRRWGITESSDPTPAASAHPSPTPLPGLTTAPAGASGAGTVGHIDSVTVFDRHADHISH